MASNVPPELEDKFKVCKEKVMSQGNDEQAAYGICYAAVVEGKADALLEAAKAGFSFKADLSMEDRQKAVNLALDNYRPPEARISGGYIMETYEDYVIICWNGSEYYKVRYTVGPKGEAVLAPKEEWETVDQAWVAKFKAERYGGVERSKLSDSDFVFPDERAFPVMTVQDCKDAVSSWGRYQGAHSFDDFKRRLTALAKRKGFESALPDEWMKNMMGSAGKAEFKMLSVKAAGDWTLDVLAVPFGEDADGQVFDENTDVMPDTFSSPAVLYHHGIEPGKGAIQLKPIIIGKTTDMSKQKDGWHLRVLLDSAKEYAKKVWEAAKKGKAVASSDSIMHLARLNVHGKTIMYDKNLPGRIAVWPIAGISLWDAVPGNFRPASRRAVALPAMKAIYRVAGLPFPVIEDGKSVDLLHRAEEAARRTRIAKVRKAARDYLSRAEMLESLRKGD